MDACVVLLVSLAALVVLVGLVAYLALESYESPSEKAIRQIHEDSAQFMDTLDDLSTDFLRDVYHGTRR